MLEKEGASTGVVERIVPCAARTEIKKLAFKPERADDIAKRVGLEKRPIFADKL